MTYQQLPMCAPFGPLHMRTMNPAPLPERLTPVLLALLSIHAGRRH